jgi:hypothetical protein
MLSENREYTDERVIVAAEASSVFGSSVFRGDCERRNQANNKTIAAPDSSSVHDIAARMRMRYCRERSSEFSSRAARSSSRLAACVLPRLHARPRLPPMPDEPPVQPRARPPPPPPLAGGRLASARFPPPGPARVLMTAAAAPQPLSARGRHRQRPRALFALPAAAVAPQPPLARGQRPRRPLAELAKETATPAMAPGAPAPGARGAPRSAAVARARSPALGLLPSCWRSAVGIPGLP